MKNLTCICLLLFMVSGLHAQSYFYIGGGLNYSGGSFDTLNYVISRYNGTRNYLTDGMDEVRNLTGLSISAGMALNGLLLDLSYVPRIAEVSASGDAGSGPFRRDLKVRMNSINFGVGYNVIASGKFFVAPGLSFDLSAMRTFTRIAPPAEIEDTEYSEVQSETRTSISFFSQFSWGFGNSTGLMIYGRPYFQFSPFSQDVTTLNNTINPATAGSDGILETRTSNFGIIAGIALVFWG